MGGTLIAELSHLSERQRASNRTPHTLKFLVIWFNSEHNGLSDVIWFHIGGGVRALSKGHHHNHIVDVDGGSDWIAAIGGDIIGDILVGSYCVDTPLLLRRD